MAFLVHRRWPRSIRWTWFTQPELQIWLWPHLWRSILKIHGLTFKSSDLPCLRPAGLLSGWNHMSADAAAALSAAFDVLFSKLPLIRWIGPYNRYDTTNMPSPLIYIYNTHTHTEEPGAPASIFLQQRCAHLKKRARIEKIIIIRRHLLFSSHLGCVHGNKK